MDYKSKISSELDFFTDNSARGATLFLMQRREWWKNEDVQPVGLRFRRKGGEGETSEKGWTAWLTKKKVETKPTLTDKNPRAPNDHFDIAKDFK